jgi:hypothetical protein
MTEKSEPEVLSTYTMQLIGPRSFAGSIPLGMLLPLELLRETEENLTDLLPDGYRVEIKDA